MTQHQYQKISNVFARDMTTFKLIHGDWKKEEFGLLNDIQWVATEKVDGTNIRVSYIEDNLLFDGKTDRAQIPPKLQSKLQEIFLPKYEIMYDLFHGKEVILYGEGYGNSIQKGGGKYSPNVDFVLFDVKVDGGWLNRLQQEKIAESLKIDIVPVVFEGTLLDIVEFTKKGFNSAWGEFQAEGVVCKPYLEMTNKYGERVIVKIKTKDF